MSDRIDHKLVGCTVSGVKVGSAKAFVGVVESAWFCHPQGEPAVTYFHVRDVATGELWHRDLKEISLMYGEVAA